MVPVERTTAVKGGGSGAIDSVRCRKPSPARTSGAPARTFPPGPSFCGAGAARPRRAGRGRVGRARRLRCARRPRVAVLVTGDELVRARRSRSRPGGSTARTRSPSRRRWSARAPSWWPRRAVPDDRRSTRAALARGARRGGRGVVSGGVSVGPHDHVKAGAARARRRGALLGGAPAARQADLVRHARRHAGVRPARQPGVGDGHLPAVRAPGAGGAPGRGPGTRRARRALLEEAIARNPRARAGRPRPPAVRARRRASATPTTGAQGSHVLTSMLGADGLALIAPRRGRGRGRRARGGRAPVRPRDPRRLLERRRRARARVQIVHEPQSALRPRTAASGTGRWPR